MSTNTTVTAFQCGNCHAILANDIGSSLVVGNTVFDRTVTIRCYRCGEARVWRPSEIKAVDKIPIDAKPSNL